MNATTTATTPRRPAAAGSRHEARLLADLLRTSRVTLLFGEKGDGRSELIRYGVLPLLQRRGAERRRLPSAAPAAPAAERRGPRGNARRKLAERVIVFDDWDGAPLAGLQVAILSSLPMGAVLQTHSERLAGLLAEICDRVSGRFLLVLDGFDRLWSGASSAESIQDFIDHFAEAVNLPGLQVNFLLSMDAASEPMLEPLRQRIAGFADATLRLRQRNAGVGDKPAPGPVDETLPGIVVPVEALTGIAAAPAPVVPAPIPRVRRKRSKRAPVAPLPPMEVGGVYAFIESTLTQTAGAVQPWGDIEAARGEVSASAAGASGAMPPSSRVAAVSRPGPEHAGERRRHPIEPAEAFRGTPPPLEPPSPIDQWLDAATAWCRRVFRPK